ncbi:hypothetical protein KVR01_007636 [Diaporthe batatas]|uniref:uncharacterized protein n=1 Tax=Diaporthe batatas TaxID=748121 RepID=UPI001D05A03C|nr:uncharacterized protein KVR01_007636 [Diaporthe batatas]KAG8163158.1 hypothetical protein KVR01_007636 [Diaporthe batatas]
MWVRSLHNKLTSDTGPAQHRGSGSQQMRQTKLTILSPGAGTRNDLSLDGTFVPVDRRAAETRKALGFAPIGVMCSGSWGRKPLDFSVPREETQRHRRCCPEDPLAPPAPATHGLAAYCGDSLIPPLRSTICGGAWRARLAAHAEGPLSNLGGT